MLEIVFTTAKMTNLRLLKVVEGLCNLQFNNVLELLLHPFSVVTKQHYALQLVQNSSD